MGKRKRTKSRSRRTKYKKLRRRHDSLSYSDDDASRSSTSVSSSSSDDDYYRSRRARSRTRKEVKTSQRRAPRRGGSIERSPRAKKRKGSKKNGDSDARKKSYKRRPRRDVSNSSTSNGSWSCSTCQGGDSSSDDSEFERPRGRSKIKERYKRKVKHINKKSSDSSRSCSSCSEGSGYQSAERWNAENNPRRLRSVITVVREPKEKDGRELNEDTYEEEITYDHDDDYPSCRSNDSHVVAGKTELTYLSGKRQQIDAGEETFVSNFGTIEDKSSGKDCETQKDRSNPSFHEVEQNNSEAACDIVDLESILRQRAIENLRKFRGVQTNAKATANQKDEIAAVEKSPTSKAELLQIKAPIPSSNSNNSATAQTALQDSKGNNEQVIVTSGPAPSVLPHELKSVSGDQSLNEVQGEAKEGSQFEQKTMSVMRGGEMVQVSIFHLLQICMLPFGPVKHEFLKHHT